MSEQLFVLNFSADCDALLKQKYDQGYRVPRTFNTLLGDLNLPWNISIFSKGVELSDHDRCDDFVVSIGLSNHDGLKGAKRYAPKIKVQLTNAEDGAFLGDESSDFSEFTQWTENLKYCGILKPGPEIKVGARVVGRCFLILDSDVLKPAALLKAQLGAVEPATDAFFGKILRAGLAGDVALCDSVLECADGEVRAASNVLILKNEYFRKLYEFKEKVGKADYRLVFKDYSVVVVSGVLELVLTSALPSLVDWDQDQLVQLLDLGAQVDAHGLDFLKAAVQMRLVQGLPQSVKKLGALAALAELHDLPVLANVTSVRLAADPAHFHSPLDTEYDETIWAAACDVAKNSIEGTPYPIGVELE